MPPQFVYQALGTLDGVAYVSDGALLIRADRVAASPDSAGAREIGVEVLRGLLTRPGARTTRLSDLAPSRISTGTFRTADDVAVGGRYVTILRALERPLDLLTTSRDGPVILREGAAVVGALMPIRMVPEDASILPPPSPGAVRARLTSLGGARGFSTAALLDGGGEVIVDVSATAPSLIAGAAVGGLVDLDVVRGHQGRLRAGLAWFAGTPRPTAEPPKERTPLPTFSARETFDALQAVGLLGEFDIGTWVREIDRVYGHGKRDEPITEGHVHDLILRARRENEDLDHTNGRVARMEGIFLARDLHEQDEARVLDTVQALGAHYGARTVEVEDVLDIEDVFQGLGRALMQAGAKERVYLVGSSDPFVLVREKLAPAGPFRPVRVYEGVPALAPAAPPAAEVERTEPCPICDAKVSTRAKFCPACHVGLTVTAAGALDLRAPDLRRGAALVTWDFRSVPLPGYTERALRWPNAEGTPPNTVEPHADGLLYTGHLPRVATLREPFLRLRSGAVRLAFTALSAGCRVGVAVRDEPIGAATISCVLDLALPARTLFFARLVVAPGTSAQTVLVSRTLDASYLNAGARNELEIRMDGGWILGFVNGKLALRIYDPAYGIGGVGLRVGREPDAPDPSARVVLHEASVYALGESR